MAKELTDEDIIRQIVDRLQTKFPDTARNEIEKVARAEFQNMSERTVRDYLAILVERSSRKRLNKADVDR
jgi:hypothetical protein